MQYEELLVIAIKLVQNFQGLRDETKAQMLSAAESNRMSIDEYRQIIHIASKGALRHD